MAAKEPYFDQPYLCPVSATDRYRAEVSIVACIPKDANGSMHDEFRRG